ncbi:hypothetical protein LINPERHAP1_LOCUS13146 [Linum perenne]
MDQPIPTFDMPHSEVMLNLELTQRGTRQGDWVARYPRYVQFWEERFDHLVGGPWMIDPEDWSFHGEYSQWYHAHTRRGVSRRGVVMETLVDGIERLYVTTSQPYITSHDHRDMHATLRSLMHASGAMERLPDRRIPRRAPAQPTHVPHDYHVPELSHARIPPTRTVRQRRNVPVTPNLWEPDLAQWDNMQTQRPQYRDSYPLDDFQETQYTQYADYNQSQYSFQPPSSRVSPSFHPHSIHHSARVAVHSCIALQHRR